MIQCFREWFNIKLFRHSGAERSGPKCHNRGPRLSISGSPLGRPNDGRCRDMASLGLAGSAARLSPQAHGGAWGPMSGQAQIVIEGVSHTYRPPRGRAGAGARRRVARGAAARVPRAARAVGLRQVDACSISSAASCRSRPAASWSRQAGRRARPRPRHRVPALCAVSVEDGARQHPLRPRTAAHAARRSAKSARRRSSISSA